jgi:hypothetical protein
MEHSIHHAGHFSGLRVSQALDWSIVDLTGLSCANVIAYGYPQSQPVLLIDLLDFVHLTYNGGNSS